MFAQIDHFFGKLKKHDFYRRRQQTYQTADFKKFLALLSADQMRWGINFEIDITVGDL